MPRAADVVGALDGLLQPHRFEDGQHNGLQVEGRGEVTRVATAVSVNRQSIDAALEWGADALLTHHGLLWRHEGLHVRGVRRQRLARILEGGLNLISYHLPLDAHPAVGNNAALADAAGCTDVEPAFEMKGATIGAMGVADASFTDWMARLETALRKDCSVATGPFQVWPFGPQRVQRVGFISGAAPYQVQAAIDAGCDAYVTGEATEGVYHLAKEAGIHFVAAGHYLSERLGVQRLGQWLHAELGVAHRFFDVETLA